MPLLWRVVLEKRKDKNEESGFGERKSLDTK